MSNQKKPAWIRKQDLENVYATSRGWVLKRANGSEELLVAIRGLKVESEEKKAAPAPEKAPKSKKPAKEEVVVENTYPVAPEEIEEEVKSEE